MFQTLNFKTKQRKTKELLRKWLYPRNKRKLDNNNSIVEIVKVITSADIGINKSNGGKNEGMESELIVWKVLNNTESKKRFQTTQNTFQHRKNTIYSKTYIPRLNAKQFSLSQWTIVNFLRSSSVHFHLFLFLLGLCSPLYMLLLYFFS